MRSRRSRGSSRVIPWRTAGPTLKGEFARTLNLTDVQTGWVFTRSIRNNAHTRILAGLKAAATEIFDGITGLDFDNGTEFLNVPVITSAGSKGIYFTRSRPYKKNDQATIESKNNHLVRRSRMPPMPRACRSTAADTASDRRAPATKRCTVLLASGLSATNFSSREFPQHSRS